MTHIDQMPDDLWARAANLGRYAIPLDVRADQREARAELHQALVDGPVEAVADALEHIATSWSTNIHGNKIPLSRNWVTRSAGQLAEEVRDCVDSWLPFGSM